MAYCGDGINDAAALVRADVGLAMGALGIDAAVETADVVLMNDRLEAVVDAVRIARKTRRVIWQNVVLALALRRRWWSSVCWG